MKKKITYWTIVLILFLVNVYVVFSFIGNNNLALTLLISLLFATMTERLAQWLVNTIYGNNSP